MQTLDELRRINDDINRVPYITELTDDWRPAATDLMGMINGADCDSYATAKLVACYKAGWPLESLRLMLCNHPSAPAKPTGNHAVLLVDLDGETYVLCNTLSEPRLKERVPYQWLKAQVAGTNKWEVA